MGAVLKNEGGAVWCYSVKKGGSLSNAGSRISLEEAERRVSAGEAEWFGGPEAARSPHAAASVRGAYARDVQQLADKGVKIQPRDWSAAMNRDD